jgi:hypothetical protein
MRIIVSMVLAALVVTIGILLVAETMIPNSEVTYVQNHADRPLEISLRCGSLFLEERIEETIEAARRCNVDQDCVKFFPGCPFGCEAATNVSRKQEIERLLNGYDAFFGGKECERCEYKCRRSSLSSDAVECNYGQCEIVDIGVPEGVR